jgi:hypothetical protein
MSKFVAGALGAREPGIQLPALHLAVLLLHKLPAIFLKYFHREGVTAEIEALARDEPAPPPSPAVAPSAAPAGPATPVKSPASAGEAAAVATPAPQFQAAPAPSPAAGGEGWLVSYRRDLARRFLAQLADADKAALGATPTPSPAASPAAPAAERELAELCRLVEVLRVGPPAPEHGGDALAALACLLQEPEGCTPRAGRLANVQQA